MQGKQQLQGTGLEKKKKKKKMKSIPESCFKKTARNKRCLLTVDLESFRYMLKENILLVENSLV